MNQDLKNYIDQARSAGKGDDAIKQELRGAGWQESDISEAFGGGSVSSSASAVSSVAVHGTGSATKWIAMVIVGLLVAGGAGAYFAFGRNGGTSGTNGANNTSKSSGKSPSSMACTDFISNSEFTQITGYTGFKTYSSGNEPISNALNQAPGGDKFGDQLNADGIHIVTCGYAVTENGKQTADFVQDSGSGALGADLSFHITWGGSINVNPDGYYKLSIDSAKRLAEGLKNPAPEEISGVGSMAYYSDGQLLALSSNKKYSIYISSVGDKYLTKDQAIKIVQKVDSNLK